MISQRFSMIPADWISAAKGFLIALSGPVLLALGQQLVDGKIVMHDLKIVLMTALGTAIINLVRIWYRQK